MKTSGKLLTIILSVACMLSSLPGVALAESASTTVVKETLDWKYWADSANGGKGYSGGIGHGSWNTGTASIYNDYSWAEISSAGVYTAEIADTGVESDFSVTSIVYKDESTPVDTPTSDGVLWGFVGPVLSFRSMIGSETTKAMIPDKYWLDVLDISAYETGYISMKVSDVSGDVDNAYVATTFAADTGALRSSGVTFPISREKYAWTNNNDHRAAMIVGLPFADYYDVEKGGTQTILVPISKLVNEYTFKEIGIKSGNYISKVASLLKTEPDLRLFSGMGLAKKESTTKDKTFTAKISEFQILCPCAPQGVSAIRNDDGSVDITITPSTDTDVTYQVVRRAGSDVKYFDAPDCIFTDTTANPKRAYTYSAVAVDNTYNIKSAECAGVLVESTVSATTIVKEHMDWNKWADAYVGWDSYIGRGDWYYDDATIWNDYAWVDISKGVYKANIADPDVEGVNYPISDRVCIGNYSADYSTADFATPPTSDGKLWAFVGPEYAFYKMDGEYVDGNKVEGDLTAAEYKYQNVPDEYWLDVMDISEYKDTGYIAMTLSNVSGDIDNAYIVLTAATGTDALRVNNVEFPVTKEDYPKWENAQTVKAAHVVGVPLADYYDVEKSGTQTVCVPLSELINNPEFKEIGIKDPDYVSKAPQLLEKDVDLRLFHGMGVAKKESDAGDKIFTANLSDFYILSAEAPSNLTATRQADGSVKVMFDPSSDADVSYKVIRRYGDEEVTFDAPECEIVDTTTNPMKTYTYTAIAVGAAYDIQSEESNACVVESTSKNKILVYKGEGDTKVETNRAQNGTMSAGFYVEEGTAKGYFAKYTDGRLSALSCADVSTAGEWAYATLEDCAATDEIRAFLWNADMQPLCLSFTSEPFTIDSYSLTFPTYTKKAATFSVNDGDLTDDAALIALMNQYGIDATFALHEASDDTMYLGENIEIANYTTGIEMYLTEEYEDKNGNIITPPTYDECVASIETAETSIQNGMGIATKGIVWPYYTPEERVFYNDLLNYLETNGYKYAQNGFISESFDVPADWMDWAHTAWLTDEWLDTVLESADTFATLDAKDTFGIFSLAEQETGMTDEETLEAYESVFQKLASDDIWKATNIELCEYLQACDALEITDTYIYNPTDVTVYLLVNGERYAAQPGRYAVFAK